MFKLGLTNLQRRPARAFLTCAGIASAVAVLLLIDQIAASYRAQLLKELNSMGVHMMLVPLGCPYDAAARVLKGNRLEVSLPEEAVAIAKANKNVEVAAPLLIAALPRPDQGRTDMFVGLDESGVRLRTWWKAEAGLDTFPSADSIILGADAARIEMRAPGDSIYSPETKRKFKVAGVLNRTGLNDDSLFFIPLRTAQSMFNSAERITAVAIRLHDPSTLNEVAAQLRDIPGTQVVTHTEMLGTFLNILRTVRALLRSIAFVALCASIAALINTLLMSVAERQFEFSLFRALGASRAQLFTVIWFESLLLTICGIAVGVLVCASAGNLATHWLEGQLPYVEGTAFAVRPTTIALTVVAGLAVATLASLAPAWRALQVEPAPILKGGD